MTVKDPDEYIAGGKKATSGKNSSGGAGRKKDDPFLWMGDYSAGRPKNPRLDPYEKGSAATTRGRKKVTASQAVQRAWQWSDGDKRKAMERLSTLTGQPVTWETFMASWESAVKFSAVSWSQTNEGKAGRPLTPWEVLEARPVAGRGVSLSDAPKKETHKSIQEVSDGTAWSYVNKAATELLGRAATTSELREFADKAGRLARSNPQITTTLTDGKGNQTSKQKGGITGDDLELESRNMANSDPEAGAYAAASKYYNKFIEAINSRADISTGAG